MAHLRVEELQNRPAQKRVVPRRKIPQRRKPTLSISHRTGQRMSRKTYGFLDLKKIEHSSPLHSLLPCNYTALMEIRQRTRSQINRNRPSQNVHYIRSAQTYHQRRIRKLASQNFIPCNNSPRHTLYCPTEPLQRSYPIKSFAYAFIVPAVCCITLMASAQQGGLGALVKSGVKGPVVVVDLVKFRPDGAARYASYDEIAEAKLKDLGGSVIFRGVATQVSGLPTAQWDRVTFRKYPSAQAVIAMGTSKEYQAALSMRFASVKKSFVYAFSGELPKLNGEPNSGSHPMTVVPAPPSGEALYMLNLMRFKEDGGRQTYYSKYAGPALRLIQALGGEPVLILKGIVPVMANEEVDRLFLVMYPSAQSFHDMITSQEYRAIAHHRTEAIELGLIWSFARLIE